MINQFEGDKELSQGIRSGCAIIRDALIGESDDDSDTSTSHEDDHPIQPEKEDKIYVVMESHQREIL